MLKMNFWDAKWDLDMPRCPCDAHFNDWVKQNKLKNKLIYHFGTGNHHVVGLKQAADKANNIVFAITASKEEYASYIELAINRPKVSKNYLAYFGDIYLSNARLLPDFDVVTMFHLCEFFFPNTASAEYGGFTDRQMLDLYTDKTRSGGYILFYMGSMGWDKTRDMLPAWEKDKGVQRVGEFKRLLVYRKK